VMALCYSADATRIVVGTSKGKVKFYGHPAPGMPLEYITVIDVINMSARKKVSVSPIGCQTTGIFSTCHQWGVRQREYSPHVTNRMSDNGNILHTSPIGCQTTGIFSTRHQWGVRQREYSPHVTNRMPVNGNILHT